MNGFIQHAPIIALLLFFGAFIIIAYRAYRPSAKHTLQKHAFIPLKEENND